MKLSIRQQWWWNVSTSSTTFTPLCCCLLAHTRLGTGYLFPAAPVARLPLPTTTQPQEEQLTLNITDTQLSHNLLLPAAKCVNHNFAWCNAEMIINSVSNFAHKKVQRYSQYHCKSLYIQFEAAAKLLSVCFHASILNCNVQFDGNTINTVQGTVIMLTITWLHIGNIIRRQPCWYDESDTLKVSLRL